MLAPIASFAQKYGPVAPDSISYQGYLTDTLGAPIDGPTDITFKLYNGPTEIWTQTKSGVDVKDGYFDVILGGPGSDFKYLAFRGPTDIGITVGGVELAPRAPLTSVPYALAARGVYAYWSSPEYGKEGYTVIAGGPNNYAGYLAVGATIGGGGGWGVGESQADSVLGQWSVVSGGNQNRASGWSSAIGGGFRNKTNGNFSAIAGGYRNTASLFSAIGGGYDNVASWYYSTVPGGRNNEASGYFAFAAGQAAKANHGGTFVWADSANNTTGTPFSSTGPNQFLIRARGGVGIGTDAPAAQLEVTGASGNPDIVLGADLVNDDGILSTDPTAPTSDLVLRSYDDVLVHLDENNDESGLFAIYNGANSIKFSVDEAGTTTINGNLTVNGTLSKTTGTFKIDHPLDPENKYLYHSFVESPDMKNVYDGVVVLDEKGEATVELPSYFEALNQDFRYQLTAIGAPGPNLYISEKVTGNRFSIAGGSADQEISWQVTGIRKDPYAEMHRIPVEVEKPASERGTYLHPEVYVGTK